MSKILFYYDVIYERKYPRAESGDFHLFTLPIVLTLILTSVLENHGNVKNIRQSIPQEQKVIFCEIKMFLTGTSDEKFLRSYHFVSEVTFNVLKWTSYFSIGNCYKTLKWLLYFLQVLENKLWFKQNDIEVIA